MNDCECDIPGGGYCQRHHCNKSVQLAEWCRTKSSWWEAWEAGRGPGQPGSNLPHKTSRKPPDLSFPREREIICQACDQFGSVRCAAMDLGCRSSFLAVARKPSGVCPLGKWPLGG